MNIFSSIVESNNQMNFKALVKLRAMIQRSHDASSICPGSGRSGHVVSTSAEDNRLGVAIKLPGTLEAEAVAGAKIEIARFGESVGRWVHTLEKSARVGSQMQSRMLVVNALVAKKSHRLLASEKEKKKNLRSRMFLLSFFLYLSPATEQLY